MKLLLSQKLEQECFKANSSMEFLKFEDLKQAKRILTRNILQNVWCPLEIYTETIKFSYKASDAAQSSEHLLDDFKAILRLQRLSTTLKSIGTSLTEDGVFGLAEESKPSLFGEMQDLQRETENDSSVCKDKSCCFSLNINCRLFRTYVIKALRHKKSKGIVSLFKEPSY